MICFVYMMNFLRWINFNRKIKCKNVSRNNLCMLLACCHISPECPGKDARDEQARQAPELPHGLHHKQGKQLVSGRHHLAPAGIGCHHSSPISLITNTLLASLNANISHYQYVVGITHHQYHSLPIRCCQHSSPISLITNTVLASLIAVHTSLW